VKDILAKGDALEAFFRQIGAVNHTTISDLFLIGMIWTGILTETSSDKYTEYRKNIDENFEQYQTEMFEEFKKLKNLKELQEYTNKYKEKMQSICGIDK
jgi:F0F1-type ATP synthase alpha subunit